MVEVGFTPPEVTQMLPSTMNRFFTSWQQPHAFTTQRSGSLPIRAVPRRCPGLFSAVREHIDVLGRAAARDDASEARRLLARIVPEYVHETRTKPRRSREDAPAAEPATMGA